MITITLRGIKFEIMCDVKDCGHLQDFHEMDEREARIKSRAEGWTSSTRYDRCPAHKKTPTSEMKGR